MIHANLPEPYIHHVEFKQGSKPPCFTSLTLKWSKKTVSLVLKRLYKISSPNVHKWWLLLLPINATR